VTESCSTESPSDAFSLLLLLAESCVSVSCATLGLSDLPDGRTVSIELTETVLRRPRQVDAFVLSSVPSYEIAYINVMRVQ